MENLNELKNNNKISNDDINNINNSLLVDEEKTLNFVRQILMSRGNNLNNGYEIPESFDKISRDTFNQMSEIDKVYQMNLISREIAIELIANLFKSEGIKQRFKKYSNNLLNEKLTKLYELMKIKYDDLLYSLNKGNITEQEFMEKYSKLLDFESNSIQEILTSDEILRKHVK